MGKDNRNNPEKISIVCPCGHDFETVCDGEGGEFPCPACGRLNVYSGNKSVSDSELDKKGKTTVQTLSLVPRIEPGDFIGPYRVLEFIGEGGMGRVYAAEDPRLQRRVAIKVLSQKLLSKKDFVVRFQREARAIARLNDPYIVQIYFTGVHDELPYYAMEMVSGGSLEDLINDSGMDADQAATMLLQAAKGLRLASREGIIHRDIKPSNLMLDRSGRLKITDFGLAKTVEIESAITHTGTIIGTPYYMSPEQGEGGSLDLRADIYSLGATFYHLLSGNPPFDAESPIAVILKHINEKLPSLHSRNGSVPEGLSRIIAKMMAKDRAERYEDYDALIEDLEAFRQGNTEFLGRMSGAKGKSGKKKTGADKETRSSFIVLDREILDSSEDIELKRCGMFRRFFALAVDIVILCLLFTLYFKGYNPSRGEPTTCLWCALFLVITFLYFFLGDARGGMTLGKIVCHCRVGLRDGENIGFRKSFLRTLLFFPILFAPGIIKYRDDLGDFIATFFKASAGIFGVNPIHHPYGSLHPAAYMISQLCALWLIISLGFFIVTPGRTLLHDLITKSFFFSFVRRKHQRPERRGQEKGGLQKQWIPEQRVLKEGSRREGLPAEGVNGEGEDGEGANGEETGRRYGRLPTPSPPLAGAEPSPSAQPMTDAVHAARKPDSISRNERKMRPPPLPADAMNLGTHGASGPRSPSFASDRSAPSLPPHGPIRTKSPAIALFLSFFPGLGQVYNGDYIKGFVILLTFWLILPWMFGFLDAFLRARSINRMAGMTSYSG